MLIDFRSLDESIIKNFYGGEKDTSAFMFADENNRINIGVIIESNGKGSFNGATIIGVRYSFQYLS